MVPKNESATPHILSNLFLEDLENQNLKNTIDYYSAKAIPLWSPHLSHTWWTPQRPWHQSIAWMRYSWGGLVGVGLKREEKKKRVPVALARNETKGLVQSTERATPCFLCPGEKWLLLFQDLWTKQWVSFTLDSD